MKYLLKISIIFINTPLKNTLFFKIIVFLVINTQKKTPNVN